MWLYLDLMLWDVFICIIKYHKIKICFSKKSFSCKMIQLHIPRTRQRFMYTSLRISWILMHWCVTIILTNLIKPGTKYQTLVVSAVCQWILIIFVFFVSWSTETREFGSQTIVTYKTKLKHKFATIVHSLHCASLSPGVAKAWFLGETNLEPSETNIQSETNIHF